MDSHESETTEPLQPLDSGPLAGRVWRWTRHELVATGRWIRGSLLVIPFAALFAILGFSILTSPTIATFEMFCLGFWLALFGLTALYLEHKKSLWRKDSSDPLGSDKPDGIFWAETTLIGGTLIGLYFAHFQVGSPYPLIMGCLPAISLLLTSEDPKPES